MKHVVSVSLGSSKRDHQAKITLFGEEILLERKGTDGDIARAIELIASLDGKVDAFGMGGTDLWFYAGRRRYMFRDALRLARAARMTPIADGSMLKGVIERRAVEYIRDEMKIPLAGKNALIVCALDRFGMASALLESGCRMMYGDLAWGLGIPIFLRSFSTFQALVTILMPVIRLLPISFLYPVGKSQDKVVPKYHGAYAWAHVIGGDCHYIKKHMPDDLSGKVIITNTVTQDDVEAFRMRGVKTLVASTPEIEGRSFATNVMDAVLVALTGRRPEEFTPSEYLDLLNRLEIKPRVETLN